MNFFESVSKMISETGEAIGSAASYAGQTVVGTAIGAGEAIGSATSYAGQAVVEAAVGTGEAMGSAASYAGQAVVGAAVGTGEAIGSAASYAGQAVVGTAVGIGEAVGGATVQATQAVVTTAVGTGEAIGSAACYAGQTVVDTAISAGGTIGNAAIQATQTVGYTLELIANNPLFQEVKSALPQDWLVVLDKVDLVKAETEVRRLQQQYPNEQPSEIAHRIIVAKGILAAGLGLATNLLPGAGSVLDLAGTMFLQAEMVYQIACAYGLGLQDQARKAEILAIFGLSFGSEQALKFGISYAAKAGLSLIPVAGAVVGAGTNAAMLYALGYGACRFYETKLNMVPLLQGA